MYGLLLPKHPVGTKQCNGSYDLRKRDVFQPEAEAINRSFDILQLRLQRLKHLVGELEKLPASEPVVPEKIAELKAELDQFKTS